MRDASVAQVAVGPERAVHIIAKALTLASCTSVIVDHRMNG